MKKNYSAKLNHENSIKQHFVPSYRLDYSQNIECEINVRFTPFYMQNYLNSLKLLHSLWTTWPAQNLDNTIDGYYFQCWKYILNCEEIEWLGEIFWKPDCITPQLQPRVKSSLLLPPSIFFCYIYSWNTWQEILHQLRACLIFQQEQTLFQIPDLKCTWLPIIRIITPSENSQYKKQLKDILDIPSLFTAVRPS